MPWNGSGTYTLPYNWVNDANASIPITASRMDGQDGDQANALNNCITRDGQGGPTGNLPMNGFKHTGAAAGVADTDYAIMSQVNAKASLDSPAFTGTPTAPTASTADNSTQVATTAYVKSNLTSYAPLNSPTFTGLPVIPNTGMQIGANNGLLYESSAGVITLRTGSGSSAFFTFGATGSMTLSGGGITVSGNISGAAITASGLMTADSIKVGGGTQINKITISTSAPGTLGTNELWFQRAS